MAIEKVSESIYLIGAIGAIMGIGRKNTSFGNLCEDDKVYNYYSRVINSNLFIESYFMAQKDGEEEKNHLCIKLKDSDYKTIGEILFKEEDSFLPYLTSEKKELLDDGINYDKWKYIKKRWEATPVDDMKLENLKEIDKVHIHRIAIGSKIDVLCELTTQVEKKAKKLEKRISDILIN